MKISASTICWSRDDRRTALDKAAKAGFNAVELVIMAPETAPFHKHCLRTVAVETLAAEFKEFGLTCSGLHIGGLATDARLPGLLDYAHTAIDAAAALGANLLVMGGPDRAAEPFRPYIEAVESLVPHLERKNVRLGLENHYLNWVQFVQDYDFIFDFIQSPMVGMTLDTGHFASAGVDPAEVAVKFAPYVFNVHIKDHFGHHSVEMGMGTTNNRGCVLALRDSGYSGCLTLEIEVARELADTAAVNGFAYMQVLAGQQRGKKEMRP
jgi:sugar phosphate isomerase/epimerase